MGGKRSTKTKPVRDEFSRQTIETIAKRAGSLCSNPYCRKVTTGPRTDDMKSVNVGVAGHITAAAPGGPRYDPTLSSEQRRSATNGIHLCQTHAKLVDNDPDRYTVSVLRLWKEETEAAARAAVEGRTTIEAARPGQERRLEVSLTPGAIASPLGLTDLQAFVEIANPGPRSVTVSVLELHLEDGVRLAIPVPYGEVNLPHRLEDGQSCKLWVPARDLAEKLRELGYSDRVRLSAVVRDAVGDEFKSESNEINVDGLLGQ